LTPAERLGYQVGALVNETPIGKRAASAYLTVFSQHWMRFFTHPICEMVGVENVPMDRSYILAANHRTFWDFFATMCELWPLMPKGHKPYLYCPVRSKFFYEKRVGTALNLLVSAHSMYPPIFRDDRGADLNGIAVRKCVELLAFSPRTVIAIHPEGKRNLSDDPYQLLPAKAGVGRIALAAPGTPVIPLFLNGMGGDLKDIWTGRQSREMGRIRMEFGTPVDLGDLYARADEPAGHQAASDRIMVRIAALGENDRAARAAR
jgi:1-acyl-sn-glycerol-3-phosphate acyltransferase